MVIEIFKWFIMFMAIVLFVDLVSIFQKPILFINKTDGQVQSFTVVIVPVW